MIYNNTDFEQFEEGLPNASYILGLLRQLTSEQLEDLYRQLGLKRHEDLIEWIPQLAKVNDHHSYEKRLMQFGTFHAHKILLFYVPPVLIVLGTFGNLFSFIILKNRAMLKFSTYFYLMVMAVADTLVLYVGLMPLWLGELTGLDIRDRTDWTCKLTNAVGYTVSDFSVWLIIAVTVERYLVVCHPFQANSVCSSTRAHRVVFSLLAVFACLNLHFCWTVHIVYYVHNGDRIPQCTALDRHARLVIDVWPWVDVIVYSLLPFVLIVALNGMIIRQVVVARGRRCDLRHNCPVVASNNKYQQRRPSQEGSTRLTVMLMTISFAFLLTTLPMSVVNIASAFCRGECSDDERRQSYFRLARTVTELLMYANHSMNFFLYCATGQKFRHQLVWMVCYTARRTYVLGWRSSVPPVVVGAAAAAATVPQPTAMRMATSGLRGRLGRRRRKRAEVTLETLRCIVSWRRSSSSSAPADAEKSCVDGREGGGGRGGARSTSRGARYKFAAGDGRQTKRANVRHSDHSVTGFTDPTALTTRRPFGQPAASI